jgi:hypothetical protein
LFSETSAYTRGIGFSLRGHCRLRRGSFHLIANLPVLPIRRIQFDRAADQRQGFLTALEASVLLDHPHVGRSGCRRIDEAVPRQRPHEEPCVGRHHERDACDRTVGTTGAIRRVLRECVETARIVLVQRRNGDHDGYRVDQDGHLRWNC